MGAGGAHPSQGMVACKRMARQAEQAVSTVERRDLSVSPAATTTRPACSSKAEKRRRTIEQTSITWFMCVRVVLAVYVRVVCTVRAHAYLWSWTRTWCTRLTAVVCGGGAYARAWALLLINFDTLIHS